MSVAALGGIASLVGAVGSFKSSSDASNRANKAQKQSDQVTQAQLKQMDMQMKLYEELLGSVRQWDQQGAFDADKLGKGLIQDAAYNSKIGGDNLAGSMRIAGYKPGDSEIGMQVGAYGRGVAKDLNRNLLDLKANEPQRKLNAYLSASGVNVTSPNQGAMQNAASNYGQQAQQYAQSGSQSLMNLFSLIPNQGGGSQPVNVSGKPLHPGVF